MKDTRRVSELLLERYRFGDVSTEEREFVDKALEADKELRSRYEAQGELYRDVRQRYPLESMTVLENFRDAVVPARKPGFPRQTAPVRGRFLNRKRVAALCVAAALLCVLFPSILFLRERSSEAWPEISGGQGAVRGDIQTELFLNLQTPGGPKPLSDQDRLNQGDTVELEYIAQPGDNYGLVFSINANAKTTLHYPRSEGASGELVIGRRTVLAKPYILDGAPDFETFFFVVSQNPLDTAMILETARKLAAEPKTAIEKSTAAFEGYEVKIITIRK